MKKYQNIIIGILVTFTAISISICAASYSIFGLGKLFSGAYNSVIIMATCLEVSKIVLTGTLHIYWNDLDNRLKIYLVSATVVLMIITSMGIYGFLSDAYSQTKFKDDITERKIDIVRLKKNRFDEQIANFQNEKNTLNNDMNKLRENMSTTTQTQRIDEKTGQLLTNTSNGNKKLIAQQIEETSKRRDFVESQITPLQDSSSKLEIQIIEIESNSTTSSELGPLKYISKISTVPMDNVVNYFLLLLILVFDPLALALIILAIDIFKIKKIIPIVHESINAELNVPEVVDPIIKEEEIVPIINEELEIYPIDEQHDLDVEYLTNNVLNEFNDNTESLGNVVEEPKQQEKIEDETPEYIWENLDYDKIVKEDTTVVETPTHLTIPIDERIEIPKKKRSTVSSNTPKQPSTKRKKTVTIVKDELPPAITNHLARSISKSEIKNTPHQQLNKQ